MEKLAMSELSRRRILQLASTGALLGAWSPAAQAETPNSHYADAIERSRRQVLEVLDKTATPSATVSLVKRDGVVWSEAFGFVDKLARQRANTDTLFCIGSCSKVIAAAAVMKLAERKLLELDAPIVEYLSDFSMASPDYDQVTVRMLLNHASGFPGTNYRNAFTASPHHEYLEETVGTLRELRLKHPPGEYSVYCNDGFTVAELLVQRVSGMPYTEFVTHEILTPLGMAGSRFAVEPFPPGGFAPAYRGEIRQVMEFINLYGSGGLYSSAKDMSFFLRMLLNGGAHAGHRVLNPGSIDEMASNQTIRNSFRPVANRDGYGLGWDGVMHDDFAVAGITAWHKSGGTSAYSSFMIVLPEEGLAVFTSGASPAYSAPRVAEYVLSQALVDNGRVKEFDLLPSTSRSSASPGEELVNQLEGIYAYYAGVMRIEKDGAGGLHVIDFENGNWSGTPSPLVFDAEGSFADVRSPETSFRPLATGGQDYLIVRTPPGIGRGVIEVPFFQKMPLGPELSPAWKRRLGKRWLLVNEAASSLIFDLAAPTLRLSSIPGLPGYVVINSPSSDTNNQLVDAAMSNDVAEMCLRIPVANGRDLNDLRVVPSADGEWLKLGGYLFRPEASVPALTTGAVNLAVKAPDQGSWLKVDAMAAGVIKLTGATDWKLFDGMFSLTGSSNRVGAADSLAIEHGQHFLLAYGHPGTVISVAL
jgi:CubicO group peptidase (beta-lactamase class C family)